MERCTGHCNIREILLKTELNTIQLSTHLVCLVHALTRGLPHLHSTFVKNRSYMSLYNEGSLESVL